jgi:hypothetical protein
MIRLTLEAMFANIYANKNIESIIRMSYVEINNEILYDLVNEGKEIN